MRRARPSRSRACSRVDVGGSHVKALLQGESERRRFESGPKLTPEQMAEGVRGLVDGWSFDRVSIGIPTPVRGGMPVAEPVNLGTGWVGFDYDAAFGVADEDRERRGHAGDRQLRGRAHALPRASGPGSARR